MSRFIMFLGFMTFGIQVDSISHEHDKNSITLYDCGGKYSPPRLQAFSLNNPDTCSNSSTRYKTERKTRIQVVQVPKTTPIDVTSCLIKVTISVGFCGTNGITNMMHAMRIISKKVIYPTAVECIHALNTNVMVSTIPRYGTSPSFRITKELVQGMSSWEEFSVGYSTTNSDCRSASFTPPKGKTVSRAVVKYSGTIMVRSKRGNLVKNRTELIITDEVIFNRQSILDRTREKKVNDHSVGATLFKSALEKYESFQDPVFGVYVIKKKDIPLTECDTARTIWTSNEVIFHEALKKSGAIEDIIEVKGKQEGSEMVALSLKGKTNICGRAARRTAVGEVFIVELGMSESKLDIEEMHSIELDRWVNLKSMIMSTVSSTELSLDEDFNVISYQICENNRQLLIAKMREVRQNAESVIYDENGFPMLNVRSGELVYLFHCTPVLGRLRTVSKQCCQELPIWTADNSEMYMVPVSKRLTTHCTPRSCSSSLPAGYNLGTNDDPKWVYVGSTGDPYEGKIPNSFQFSKVLERGVNLIEFNGLYTEEQREDMMLQTERGDAVNQVINHLAARVVESGDMFGYSSSLNERFQRSLEAATTPWPYNCLSFIPIWLRVVLALVMGGFLIKLLGEPVGIIFSAAKDSALSWSHVLTTLFFSKHSQLRLTKDLVKLDNAIKGKESINLKEVGGVDRLTECFNDLEARVQKLEEHKKPTTGVVRRDSIVTSLGGTGRARRI